MCSLLCDASGGDDGGGGRGLQEKCLAVQDPFVLSHNITQNVGHMMLKHLENSLSNAAAKVCRFHLSILLPLTFTY